VKCKNYSTCHNRADGTDRLCSCCRIVAESAERGEKINREYWRLTQKPIKPNVFREIEKGAK
jgi:hypothetical protein